MRVVVWYSSNSYLVARAWVIWMEGEAHTNTNPISYRERERKTIYETWMRVSIKFASVRSRWKANNYKRYNIYKVREKERERKSENFLISTTYTKLVAKQKKNKNNFFRSLQSSFYARAQLLLKNFNLYSIMCVVFGFFLLLLLFIVYVLDRILSFYFLKTCNLYLRLQLLQPWKKHTNTQIKVCLTISVPNESRNCLVIKVFIKTTPFKNK